MKLALKFYPKLDEIQQSIIEELSFHTTKLYNIANYMCYETAAYKDYYTLEKELKSNWHREYLHAHTYQQCLKVLDQNWKSFFNAHQDYKDNPLKYKEEPRSPKYKNTEKRKNEVIFTNVSIRRRGNQIWLSISKKMQERFEVKSLKVEVTKKLPLPQHALLQQMRIQYDYLQKRWFIVIIYKIEERKPVDHPHLLSIDLGLDNLATITFSHLEESYILCGRKLKSMNSHMNKQVARLQSIRMKQTRSDTFKNTKQIRSLRRKRKDRIQNYMHQASRIIVNMAKDHQVGTIVIGDLKGIKQESPLKTFVQIPIGRFVELIKYKAALEGIQVNMIQENYTSGVSSIDLEPITKKYYNQKRRIVRGLFETTLGYMNSDVNGSLNILRKHTKDQGIPKLITSARDKGCVTSPTRIRAA